MRSLYEPKPAEIPDWDAMYSQGTPHWETGVPAGELARVVREQRDALGRGRVLELGCGTGADAIYLTREGFEVTAIDSSPTAIERARARAEHEGVLPRFVLADLFEFTKDAEPFDLVYDAGLYPFIRRVDLDRYLDMLWRVTRPGTFFLALVGATGESAAGGPPQVSKREVRDELGRLFEFLHLRSCRLQGPHRDKGYLGWSCLMQRPAVSG